MWVSTGAGTGFSVTESPKWAPLVASALRCMYMRAMDPPIRLTLFGPPRLEVGGATAPVDTRKALALVAYVAMAERPQPRDVLVELLWPDVPAERGRATLRRTLSTLRSALGGRWVEADRAVVRLAAEGGAVDVVTFRRLLAETAAHAPSHASGACPSCLGRLEDAVRISGAPFMQGFSLRDAPGFEEWRDGTAVALDRARVRALDQLSAALFHAGNHAGAIDAARERLAIDPLSEETHRRLIELYGAAGDPGAAISQYRECAAILDRELGVGPLPETVAVYEAILRGAEPVQATNARAAPPVITEGPFVGRAGELARIGGAVASARTRARLVTLQGEAGVGKTRLAREALAHLRTDGAEVISVECREGEQEIAFGVVTAILDECMQVIPASRVEAHALRAAASLLPWLAGDTAIQEDDAGAQIRLYEAIRHIVATALSGSPPGVLFIDNAQWLDAASLEALSYFMRRIGDSPLAVLVAWRAEETTSEHPLTDFARLADERVELGRFTDSEVELLLRTLVTAEVLEHDAVDRVRASSEGLPLFVVEYAAALVTGSDEGLPTNVRELVRSKLERLPEATRQLLGAAAVIGRDFGVDELTQVAGRSDFETVESVDRLVAQHVLVERPGEPVTFVFSHDKIREFTLEQMGPARRQLLHRRVAQALVDRIARGGRGTPPAALLAYHWERGGRAAEAGEWHARAAEEARQKLAHDDAVRHLESALALGHGPAPEINEALGDVHRLRGSYAAALRHFEAAAAGAGDAASRARLEHKLGDVYARRGDWSLARAHLSRALEEGEELRQGPVLSDLAVVMHRLDDAATAEDLAEQALVAAGSAADDRGLAHASNIAGMLAHARGDQDQAVDRLRRSLELARVVDDHAAAIAALNNLALVHRSGGDPAAALERTTEALALSSEVGDRHRQAALHNNMADLLHQMGDRDASLEHLRAATALFGDIGYDDTGPLPEVWKLVSW